MYFVLFFPGVYLSGFSGGEAVPFALLRELGRTLTYTIPSLTLLWYLITDKKGFGSLREIKPEKHDILTFALGFPGLIIISLFISLLAYLFSQKLGINPPPKIEGPETAAGYAILVFSCLGTGYLEESYFRYYLLARLESAIPLTALRIALSTLLFSLCHIYEGPWGILNAIMAGVLLSIFFIKWRSIHGIAWAHGAYNLFVYIMGNFGR